MTMRVRILFIITALGLMGVSKPAHALLNQRFGLGIGLVQTTNPNQTSFEVGAEYEYRLSEFWGLGGSGNLIFSDPTLTVLALPEIFLHPFTTDLYVSASPLLEMSSAKTSAGFGLGTRIPIELGVVGVVPQLSVDFINGRQRYIFGLGVHI